MIELKTVGRWVVGTPGGAVVHFRRLDPLPSREALDKLSQDLYSKTIPDFGEVKDRDAKWHGVIWRDLLNRLAGETYGLNLLDVGSGLGHFVREAEKAGFYASGMDTSQDALEQAQQPMVDCAIEDAAPVGTWGVVTMFNVLEHLRDPRIALERCHGLLKERGLLYVSVPNDFNPLQRLLKRRYGEYWVHESHVSYFTPPSLKALCSAVGFEVIWQSTSFPMEVFALLGCPYPKDAERGNKWHALRKWLDCRGLYRFYPLLAKMGLGRHINLLMRKTGRDEKDQPSSA